MIWPFNRGPKPKVRDCRVPNDFQPGDKVECINDGWAEHFPFNPEKGDILTVVLVTDAVNERNIQAYWLFFGSTQDVGYSSQAFRKIVETDDPAVIARIKAPPKREVV